MMLKLSTVFFLVLFSVLASIHIIALKLFLYWKFSWFDIPMHFLGGVVVTLGLFTLYDLKFLIKERHLQLFPVILIVFAVALAWEVYEILIGVPIDENYVIDTLTDLSMGLFGGLVGYSIGRSIKKL